MRRAALRAGAAAGALAGLLALTAGPAAAIESPEFRLEPVDRDGPRANLREALRPGRTTTDAVVLTNKTDRPLPLRLSVAPATVGPDGSVRLTGSEAVASWVKLEDGLVTLAPRSSRAVRFVVHAPRELPGTAMTMAIVAEPAAPSHAPVAVLQRLAVMAYLAPAGSSLVASLGWVLWVAAAALAVVVGVALSPTQRGRRRVARLSALR
ncbi:MAG: hypothetical protein M3Q48_01415, partial [Actinomycetota bacterium]|nr:hypothetical protein [Actinomycetota bacterium]